MTYCSSPQCPLWGHKLGPTYESGAEPINYYQLFDFVLSVYDEEVEWRMQDLGIAHWSACLCFNPEVPVHQETHKET